MGVRQSEGSGVDMSYNGPQVPLYRPLQGAVPHEQWTDDALCVNFDPSLFELDDPPGLLGAGGRVRQEDRIAEGLRICSGCPVRAACRANSSEHDRYWSTRGGQPPEGLFQDSKEPKFIPYPNGIAGGFRAGEGPERVPAKKCKRGHENWLVRPNGRRECRDCVQLRNRARAKGATLVS